MLKRINSSSLILIAVVMMLLTSCEKDYEVIENIDDVKISEYLSKSGVSATKDASGYYYQVVQAGEGELFERTDSVRYRVEVKSLNGTSYYSSPQFANQGTFVGYTNRLLGLEIGAINETLQKIAPGGTVRLILPSYLAFGKNGQDFLNIPSNEVLDVTIRTYSETQAELDDMHIRDFLSSNNITATKDASGVYYVVTDAGTGEPVTNIYSDLTVNYVGRAIGGSVFDSRDGSTGMLGGFMSDWNGWKILTKFKQGAKLRLFIPSVLAHGSQGSEKFGVVIPPNTSLDFDIELTKVVN